MHVPGDRHDQKTCLQVYNPAGFSAAAPQEVTIIRVLHGARDIPEILAPNDSGQ